MKRPVGPLLCFAIGVVGLMSLPLRAELTARGHPMEMLRSGGVVLTAEQEEQDAREMTALINQAVAVRREVVITLHNDTSIVVGGPVTTQRYWLVVTLQDRSEIRFRASMIASVKIR
jgi:hypothetical protein